MALEEEDVQISILENESKHYHSNVELTGILTLHPKQEKKGIVIFAHGSGSGRDSPRNQYVASVLNNSNSGIGTLLVDLLTLEEQQIDEKTREYRFNIKLLANRLAAVTDWLLRNYRLGTRNISSSLSIGYFGSSTGAAAALIAAAERSDDVVVKAIVSRGGRPDLVNTSHLKKVQASTLFLVGSKDNPQVIALNQKAFQQLKNVKEKRLVIIPGAGHLFEEPSTLEEAAKHAASWFEKYL